MKTVIIQIVYNLVHIYSLILLAYCIISWFPGAHGYGTLGKVYRFLAKIVDPYLNIFRKIIPPIGGTIDISPIIAIFVLEAVVNFIFMLFR